MHPKCFGGTVAWRLQKSGQLLMAPEVGVPGPKSVKTERKIVWRGRADFFRLVPLAAVVLVFWWFFGRYGFNPTDDGFILGQSWRMLQGETPHVDFTSPRPLGSAILHLPELLNPWGTLAVSRLVVALQLMWIAIATVEMFPALRKKGRIEHFCLVTIAFIVNVGVWPLMAWHTIDGLFFGATALWLSVRPVTTGRWSWYQWGALWLIAGFAPLIKQGFLIVPLLVVLLLVVHRRWRALFFAPLALIPGVLYLLFTIETPGGVTGQLYSGSILELYTPLSAFIAGVTDSRGTLVMVCVLSAVFLLRFGVGSRVVNMFIALGLVTAPILLLGRMEGFSIGGFWSYSAIMCLLALTALLVRDVQRLAAIVAIFGLAYAVAMSWGAPAPTLLAGTLLVFSVSLVLDEYQLQEETPRHGILFVAALLLVVSVAVSLVLQSRTVDVYKEIAQDGLTATVDDSKFWLIKMSPQSAAYVEDVRSCLRKYPASKVAILPDGAGLYPLLGMTNPFHSDWWLIQEQSADHLERVESQIQELNADRDWLVLFQSYSLFDLRNLSVSEVTETGQPFSYIPADTRILGSLDGIEVECGSLTGEYSVGLGE